MNLTFTATLEAYRENEGRASPKLLLTNVKHITGETFRDHAWVSWSKRFKKVEFGDVIEFTAEEEVYKSSDGMKIGLHHLRNIKKVINE